MRFGLIFLLSCTRTIIVRTPDPPIEKIQECEALLNPPSGPTFPPIVGFPDGSQTIMVSKSDAQAMEQPLATYFEVDEAWKRAVYECLKALTRSR